LGITCVDLFVWVVLGFVPHCRILQKAGSSAYGKMLMVVEDAEKREQMRQRKEGQLHTLTPKAPSSASTSSTGEASPLPSQHGRTMTVVQQPKVSMSHMNTGTMKRFESVRHDKSSMQCSG
jgi:hypothetical protein